MDRGGLWYIKETTYSLSVSIEEETRECLKTPSSPTPKSKEEIIKSITSSEDVPTGSLLVPILKQMMIKSLKYCFK